MNFTITNYLFLKIWNLLFVVAFALPVISQPVASFTATPVKGCNPVKVDFTNTSSGATNYLWKFGNGNISSLTSPSAIYNNPGKYTVTLIATDASGKSDTVIYADLITAFKNPNADFSASVKGICAGDTVFFTDKSTPGDGAITTYSWDMGDGGTTTAKDPAYRYLLDGSFNVILSIQDVNGCISFAKYPKLITSNKLPTAIITNSPVQKCTVPVNIGFTSSAGGVGTLVYDWDYGDGSKGTGSSPNHTYNTAGKFTISLKVTDTNGCKITTTMGGLITLLPPVADFDTTKKYICPHESVQFVNTSTPIDGTGKFQWNFSNGVASTTTDPNVTFHYPGTYDVTLKYSWDGCSDTKFIKSYVTVRDTPTGIVTPKDTIVCRSGSGIPFFAKGTDIHHILWDSKQTGQQYIYGKDSFVFPVNTNGRHTIFAIAVNKYGCKTPLDSSHITVRGPTASIFTDSSKGCIPYNVIAKWNGSSASPIKTFAWSGDGLTGTDSILKFQNTNFGKRIIQLIVTDVNGCSEKSSTTIEAGLKVNMSVTAPLKVCRNQKFYLTRKSDISGIDSVKFFYNWNNKDSFPFPPPDSILRRLFDTPNTIYKYGLIANSFGCITRLDSNKRAIVKVMGPMLDATVKSDCVKDSVIGLNKSKAYTKTWWRFENAAGNIQINNNIKLQRLIDDTKKLWLIAENDTNKCIDSLPFNTTVDIQRASFDYSFDCNTQSITTNNTYIGLADSQFYWELTNYQTGIKTQYQGKNITIKLNAVGDYNLLLSPVNPKYTCTRPFSRKITVYQRPSVKAASSLVSNKCYPVTINLDDPTWKKWKNGKWEIGRFLTVKDSQQKFSINYIDNESNLNIFLTRFDSNSCIYKDTFSFFVGGVKATIDAKQVTDPCRFSEITTNAKLTNGTNGALYTYLWDWGFKTTSDSRDTVIESGIKTLPLTLLVKDNKGCESKDATVFQVKTGRPTAAFKVSDSTAACPPLNVFFKDISNSGNSPIVNWLWDFGDSSGSLKQDPGKIYIFPGRFGVKLIITNAEGCKDTIRKPDLILLNGPTGNYKANINEGCAPLLVRLTTQLRGQIAKIQFDMGDGTFLSGKDSQYTFIRAGIYIPRLILIDSLGCKFSPLPDDTLMVHAHPIADFDNFKACNNRVYPLYNHSFYDIDKKAAVVWKKDHVIAGYSDTAYMQFDPGRNHTVQLNIVSNFGCKDSVEKPFVSYNINPAIAPGKAKYCLGEKIKILNTSTADTNIVQSDIWIDGLPLNPINMTIPGSSRGIIPALMIVKDALGCQDTISDPLFIKVGDTLPPPPLFIYRSSVLDNYSTETKFNRSIEPDFDQYNLFTWINGAWKKMAISTNISDTNLIARGLNTLDKSYCHTVSQTNFCYRSSDSIQLIPHCTIELKAKGDTNVSVLNWTSYLGWKNVNQYRIWRKKKSDSVYVLLDSVNGNVLGYIDTAIYCHIVYDYKIEGKEENGFFENSFSDTARAKPIHFIPVPSPEVWRTSVDTNAYTHTEWILNQKLKYPIDHYRIWKYENTGWTVLMDSIPTSILYQNDNQTEVQLYNYTYAVDATDVCETVSLKGNIGRSILLKIAPVGSEINPRLNWTAYMDWNEGVKGYLIERSLEKSPFIPLKMLDANTLTYLDESLPTHCAKDFIYRVTAIRNQPTTFPDSTINCKSVSNYATFDPEIRFFIPNAFTPDKNNLNEGFHPDGIYFYNYNMKIYNRFGQKVYEGDTCMNEWDGKYNGENAQDGVYAYIIDVYDLKGNPLHFKGTLHLMR